MNQNYNGSGGGGQGGNIFRVIVGIAILLAGLGILGTFYRLDTLDLGFKLPDIKFDLFKKKSEKAVITKPVSKSPTEISNKDLTLISLKFYEGGYYGCEEKDRVYSDAFLKNNTRYIWWELTCKNNNYKTKKISVPIKMMWYNPKGNLVTKDNITFNVEKEWKKAWYVWGWGSTKPGSWKHGKYTVKIYYKDKLFASNSYIVK